MVGVLTDGGPSDRTVDIFGLARVQLRVSQCAAHSAESTSGRRSCISAFGIEVFFDAP